MTETYSEAVSTARDYYNSDDAEAFYSTIWGGEDIHIGLYEGIDDSIATASRRSVENLARRLEPLDASCRILDMGSGYGGSARYLAHTYGSHVVGLNLSEVENERARRLNREQSLADRIDIVDGSFEAVDAADDSFNAVCSQDAFLHSGERARVVAEAARVLKPGGVFAFTDIMQADDCPDGVLDPILARIHLSSLASPGSYRKTAAATGLDEAAAFTDLTPQLVTHYQRVLVETEQGEAALHGKISDEYMRHMKAGLTHWIEGGEQGRLVWGVFTFRKPAGA